MIQNARSNRNIGILKNRPFKVIVCAITAMAFFVNIFAYDLAFFHPVAWAAGTPSGLTGVSSDRAGSPGLLHKELNVATFTLPAYLGHIKDSYTTPHSKLVIHIQDAHCNYAAQHRITDIIEYLNREYGVNTVNLEGGAKDYDLSMFTRIEDKVIREKVADSFVKEGLVNGAEYYAINNPDKVSLWGIEDVGLYIENLNVYRESLKHKEEIDRDLKALNHILSNLKTKIYSKDLFGIDLSYVSYKGGNLEFKDYLASLLSKAKECLVDVKALKNIYLLSQTLEEEGRIDFKKANIERDNMIDRLQKMISKNSLEELVLKTLEFKTEKISHTDFYSYLLNKARSVNMDMAGYPELARYIAYISIYNSIDKSKVMEELDTLENLVKESLYENDNQRKLDKLSKNLALLKNIFDVSLTKDDYKYYKANESSFDMRNFTSFIDKNAPAYGLTAKLDYDIAKLDDYREDISKFYECSLKRDRAFLKNMKGLSQSPSSLRGATKGSDEAISTSAAILITGGFHTENLAELFKKNNISYISIMPNFKNGNGYESPYFRLLAGEVTGIEKRLYSVLATKNEVSTIQIAAWLSPAIAKAVWGEEKINLMEVELEIAKRLAENKGPCIVEGIGKESLRFNMDENGRVTMIVIPTASLTNEERIAAIAIKRPIVAETPAAIRALARKAYESAILEVGRNNYDSVASLDEAIQAARANRPALGARKPSGLAALDKKLEEIRAQKRAALIREYEYILLALEQGNYPDEESLSRAVDEVRARRIDPENNKERRAIEANDKRLEEIRQATLSQIVRTKERIAKRRDEIIAARREVPQKGLKHTLPDVWSGHFREFFIPGKSDEAVRITILPHREKEKADEKYNIAITNKDDNLIGDIYVFVKEDAVRIDYEAVFFYAQNKAQNMNTYGRIVFNWLFQQAASANKEVEFRDLRIGDLWWAVGHISNMKIQLFVDGQEQWVSRDSLIRRFKEGVQLFYDKYGIEDPPLMPNELRLIHYPFIRGTPHPEEDLAKVIISAVTPPAAVRRSASGMAVGVPAIETTTSPLIQQGLRTGFMLGRSLSFRKGDIGTLKINPWDVMTMPITAQTLQVQTWLQEYQKSCRLLNDAHPIVTELQRYLNSMAEPGKPRARLLVGIDGTHPFAASIGTNIIINLSLIRALKTLDEVVAVLAHEQGHVESQSGLLDSLGDLLNSVISGARMQEYSADHVTYSKLQRIRLYPEALQDALKNIARPNSMQDLAHGSVSKRIILGRIKRNYVDYEHGGSPTNQTITLNRDWKLRAVVPDMMERLTESRYGKDFENAVNEAAPSLMKAALEALVTKAADTWGGTKEDVLNSLQKVHYILNHYKERIDKEAAGRGWTDGQKETVFISILMNMIDRNQWNRLYLAEYKKESLSDRLYYVGRRAKDYLKLMRDIENLNSEIKNIFRNSVIAILKDAMGLELLGSLDDNTFLGVRINNYYDDHITFMADLVVRDAEVASRVLANPVDINNPSYLTVFVPILKQLSTISHHPDNYLLFNLSDIVLRYSLNFWETHENNESNLHLLIWHIEQAQSVYAAQLGVDINKIYKIPGGSDTLGAIAGQTGISRPSILGWLTREEDTALNNLVKALKEKDAALFSQCIESPQGILGTIGAEGNVYHIKEALRGDASVQDWVISGIVNYWSSDSATVPHPLGDNLFRQYSLYYEKIFDSFGESSVDPAIKDKLIRFSYGLEILMKSLPAITEKRPLDVFMDYLASDTVMEFLQILPLAVIAKISEQMNLMLRREEDLKKNDSLYAQYADKVLSSPVFNILRNRSSEHIKKAPSLESAQKMHKYLVESSSHLYSPMPIDNIIGISEEQSRWLLSINEAYFAYIEQKINLATNLDEPRNAVEYYFVLYRLLPNTAASKTILHAYAYRLIDNLPNDTLLVFLKRLADEQMLTEDIYNYFVNNKISTLSEFGYFRQARDEYIERISQIGSTRLSIEVLADTALDGILSAEKARALFSAMMNSYESGDDLLVELAASWFLGSVGLGMPLGYSIDMVEERLHVTGPGKNNFTPFTNFMDQLYDAPDAVKFMIMEKLLTGPNGMLHTEEGRTAFAEIVYRRLPQDGELSKLLHDILVSSVNTLDAERMFLIMYKPLLSLFLRRPKIATDFPLDKVAAAIMKDKDHIKTRGNELLIYAARRLFPHLSVDQIRDFLATYMDRPAPSPTAEAITGMRERLSLRLQGSLGIAMDRAPIQAAAPGEDIRKLTEAGPLDIIIEACQNLGPVGVRFLQILGQYLPVSEEYQKRFSAMYDATEGQDKFTAFSTLVDAAKTNWEIRRFIEEDLVSIDERLGGGSIVTVFAITVKKRDDNGRIIEGDSEQQVLKIRVPNAESQVNDIVDMALETVKNLRRSSRWRDRANYVVAERILKDIKEWVIRDIQDPDFMRLDPKYRMAHENYAAPNGIKVRVPAAYSPNNKDMKREELVKGVTLNKLLQLARSGKSLSQLIEEEKNADTKTYLEELKSDNGNRDVDLAGLVKKMTGAIIADYARHLVSPIFREYYGMYEHRTFLLHSDMHFGNAMAPDLTTACPIDRNFYIKFEDQHDVDFIRTMVGTKNDWKLLNLIVNYFLDLSANANNPVNRGVLRSVSRTALIGSIGLKMKFSPKGDEAASLSKILQELELRGITIPLNMRLVFKNLGSINSMLREAEAGRFEDYIIEAEKLAGLPDVVPAAERRSASGIAPAPPEVIAYRGMSLMELEMIVKFGKVINFDQDYKATFSMGPEPSFQSGNAPMRRRSGREVLIQFKFPQSRLRPTGYAFTLVRDDTDIVPEGYVKELKKKYDLALAEQKICEEKFLRAKTAYIEQNPADGRRKIMSAMNTQFWSQPDVVAYVENSHALKYLPGLISRFETAVSNIAVVDASTIDWKKFEKDNRNAFADSSYDRERLNVILALIKEGEQRWGRDSHIRASASGKAPETQFREGDIVTHDSYGRGKIIGFPKNVRKEQFVSVEFAGDRVEIFPLEYAAKVLQITEKTAVKETVASSTIRESIRDALRTYLNEPDESDEAAGKIYELIEEGIDIKHGEDYLWKEETQEEIELKAMQEVNRLLVESIAGLQIAPHRAIEILEKEHGKGVVVRLPISLSSFKKIIANYRERSFALFAHGNQAYLLCIPGSGVGETGYVDQADNSKAASEYRTFMIFADVFGHSHPINSVVRPSNDIDIGIGTLAEHLQSNFIAVVNSKSELQVTVRPKGQMNFEIFKDAAAEDKLAELGIVKSETRDSASGMAETRSFTGEEAGEVEGRLESLRHLDMQRFSDNEAEAIRALKAETDNIEEMLKKAVCERVSNFEICGYWSEAIRIVLGKAAGYLNIDKNRVAIALAGSASRGGLPFGSDIDFFVLANGSENASYALEVSDNISAFLKILNVDADEYIKKINLNSIAENLVDNLSTSQGRIGAGVLLDMQYIYGNEELFNKVKNTFDKSLSQKAGYDAMIAAMRDELSRSREILAESKKNPDILDPKQSFSRTLQIFMYYLRVRFGLKESKVSQILKRLRTLTDEKSENIFADNEVEEFINAYEFVLFLRNAFLVAGIQKFTRGPQGYYFDTNTRKTVIAGLKLQGIDENGLKNITVENIEIVSRFIGNHISARMPSSAEVIKRVNEICRQAEQTGLYDSDLEVSHLVDRLREIAANIGKAVKDVKATSLMIGISESEIPAQIEKNTEGLRNEAADVIAMLSETIAARGAIRASGSGVRIEDGYPTIIEPLSLRSPEGIQNILVVEERVERLMVVPKVGVTSSNLWPLITGLTEHYPEASITVVTNFPQLFKDEYFKGGSFRGSVVAYSPEEAVKLMEKRGIDLAVGQAGNIAKFARLNNTDLIIHVGITAPYTAYNISEKWLGSPERPIVIGITSPASLANPVTRPVYDANLTPPVYIDREGQEHAIGGFRELIDKVVPGGNFEDKGVWRLSTGISELLGLPVSKDRADAIPLVRVSKESRERAMSFLKKEYEQLHKDAVFNPQRRIYTINLDAETQAFLLNKSAWVDAIRELISNTSNAYYVIHGFGHMAEEIRRDIRSIAGEKSPDVILPEGGFGEYIDDVIGISSGVLTIDTGFAHVASGMYGVPTCVITVEGAGQWVPSRQNVRWIYVKEGRDIDIEAIKAFAEFLEGAKAAPISVRKSASGIALQTKEERSAITIEEFRDVGRTGDIVKIVVGVPADDGLTSKFASATLSLGRELAGRGFGIVKADANRHSQEGDMRQVVPFHIYATDPAATKKSYENAMNTANEQLQEDLKTASPETKGHIVFFAPEMKGLEKAPRLAGAAKEEYGGQSHITVIPDEYTDFAPEENLYPDIMFRVALGRKVAFYYTGGEQNRQDALDAINRILKRVADGYAPIVTIDDLLDILKPLRIRSVVYKNIVDYERAQKTVAVAA